MSHTCLLITDNPDLEAAVRALFVDDPLLTACRLRTQAADDPLPTDISPAAVLVSTGTAEHIPALKKHWPGSWVVLAAQPDEARQAATLSAERGVLLGVTGPSGGSLGGTLRALLSRLDLPIPIDEAGASPWLRSILDSIPYGVFIKDQTGHYRFINRESAGMLNLSPASVTGSRDTEHVLDHRIKQVREHDQHVLETGEAISYEFVDIVDGEPHFYHVDKGPFHAPGGAFEGIIGVSRNVTERIHAEDALRESETRFKHLAENAPDMIFRWSYAEGFEYVSPASVDVIGYTPEDHYADPGLSYRSIHPDDIPIYESVFSDLADPEGPRRYCVIRWQHKEGHTVYVEMRMAPIFDEYGNLIAIDGIARDITQHVVTRERLRELTTRLTQAHEEERRRIGYELHDHIGQALTVAKLRAKMMESGIEDESVRQKLGVLIDLVDEMLQDVRALSRELRPPLLDEMGWGPALELLCESFGERSGLAVVYQPAADGARLPTNSELVAYRVVQEALTNAARHAEADQIDVRTTLNDEELLITIADDGVGFDLEDATGEGGGLGLLGMQERVDTVGGTLQIDSAPGTGTRITVHLPRKEGSHEDDYHPAR